MSQKKDIADNAGLGLIVSGTGLPRLSYKKCHKMVAVVVSAGAVCVSVLRMSLGQYSDSLIVEVDDAEFLS